MRTTANSSLHFAAVFCLGFSLKTTIYHVIRVDDENHLFPSEATAILQAKKNQTTTSDHLNDPVHSLQQWCQEELHLVQDVILPESLTHLGRKIPKLVHLTSKSRCLPKLLYDNLQKWKFPEHSFVYHDDAAVERLLLLSSKKRTWPEFPHLQLARQCMISGAAMADLWRYLVLWEYGGIYADIDSCPGILFRNGSTIRKSDDAWLLVEQGGFVAQYFLAASPKHPLMYLAVTTALNNLLALANVGEQDVPKVTGPGALKTAFVRFNSKRVKTNQQSAAADETLYGKPKAGVYQGLGNRTVTVMGSATISSGWIRRECLARKDKIRAFAVMGQKHFSKTKNKQFTDSCIAHLYKIHARNDSTT